MERLILGKEEGREDSFSFSWLGGSESWLTINQIV